MKLKQMERNRIYEEINELLDQMQDLDDSLNSNADLEMLADLVADRDLRVAANLIRRNYEPSTTKDSLINGDSCYEDDDAGFLPLKHILTEFENIINCDCTESDVSFSSFVRPENEEEKKEREEETEDECDLTFYVTDEKASVNDLVIQYEF